MTAALHVTDTDQACSMQEKLASLERRILAMRARDESDDDDEKAKTDPEFERNYQQFKSEIRPIMIEMRLYFVKLTREHPQMSYEEKYKLCKVKCGEDLRRLKLEHASLEKRRKLEEMPEIADGSGAGSSMCD